jgi:predicted nuclease of predicted toxin-antitoxin system
MKVLIDECAPLALKSFLSKHGHESLTVQEAGWSGKENGELLAEAETEFDVLVTVDTNLRYQQNLAGRRLAIVVLQSSSNRLEHLRQYFRHLLWPSRRSSPGRSFRSAALTEPFDANSDAAFAKQFVALHTLETMTQAQIDGLRNMLMFTGLSNGQVTRTFPTRRSIRA